MAQDDVERLQRQIIEDLVRIDSMLAKLLPKDPALLIAPMSHGKWSLAEHGFHIVLTLEDCWARFDRALVSDQAHVGTRTWSQKIALHAVLATHRYPRGKSTLPHLEPCVMLDRTSILGHLRVARDGLIGLERQLRLGSGHRASQHPVFGPIPFGQWVRLLLIHALHHKRLMQKMLGHGTKDGLS